MKKTLPESVKTIITYQNKKLSSKFPTKDKTGFQHQNNLVYYSQCPNDQCKEDYVGESGRRIEERIIDHKKRDKNSHLLKHSRDAGYNHLWYKDFKVLGTNHRFTFKRKISEALFIKQLKPSLNVKEKSIELHLYN